MEQHELSGNNKVITNFWYKPAILKKDNSAFQCVALLIVCGRKNVRNWFVYSTCISDEASKFCILLCLRKSFWWMQSHGCKNRLQIAHTT